MRIHEEFTRYSSLSDSVITIGVLDGVHKGHIHLLKTLISEARRTGRQSVVVTFKEHPASIVNSSCKPMYITSLEDRIALISDLGIDKVVPVTFDREFSMISTEDFITILKEYMKMQTLVVGPDFAMGHMRQGDLTTLRKLSDQMQFSLHVVDNLQLSRQLVKSTTVRNAIESGNVVEAAKLLGRNFKLRGTVISGDRRGRTLGFPTANLDVSKEMAVPGNAIYATWAYVDKIRYMSSTSIGTRPTFGRNEKTIEAYLIDFEGDLYGEELCLEFVERLRPEEKYSDIQELLLQIERDVTNSKKILRSL